MIKLNKNDIAWEKIFNEYEIIDKINKDGFYKIESKTINKYRESRLMAKFDHWVNLPKIFKNNNLSILPISRNCYIIGKFDAYKKLNYDKSIKKNQVNFPSSIESIDQSTLYSESLAIHCAYLTGIIDDLAEEKTHLTISGRMSTKNFNFLIKNSSKDSYFPISVENSQCEIDAAFESKSKFLIIEAKNFTLDDFLIRQLYYPYSLWKNKISKKVIPILLTYSNNVFSFFIYKFNDPKKYNSLELVKQKNYIIAPEKITQYDLLRIIKNTKIIKEPDIPFPQADKFERVIDLLGLLVNNDLTKEDITNNYGFDARQTSYYTNSAIYLGLVKKNKKEKTYSLTEKGLKIMKKKFKQKYLSLAKSILKHEAFNKITLKYLSKLNTINKTKVIETLIKCPLYNISKKSSTIKRRAQTVISWVKWILNLTTK